MSKNYKKDKFMINVQEVTLKEGQLLAKAHDDDAEPASAADINTADPKEVAEYAASLLAELRTMAGRSGLTFLAYLTQVALEEAKIQAGKRTDT